MYICLLFQLLFSFAFAEESIRVAVLEFQSLGVDAPGLLLQLSDETRGGVLDVFPPSTSKISVLTRENILDVLEKEGKDASCLEASCAVGVGRNIGARFVIVGTLSKAENIYSLTLGVYDSETNDLLAQQTVRDKSQLALLEKTRGFSEKLIERSLGEYDEGRLGVRKIEGEDDWTVKESDLGLLSLSTPVSIDATVTLKGKKICKSLPCSVFTEKGKDTLMVRSSDCTEWKKDITVEELTKMDVELACKYGFVKVVGEGVEGIQIDGVEVSQKDKIKVSTGNHQIRVLNNCSEPYEKEVNISSLMVEDINPVWNPKYREMVVHSTWDDGEKATGRIFVDGKDVGGTDTKIRLPVCGTVEVTVDSRVYSLSEEEKKQSEVDIEFQKIEPLIKGDGYEAVLIPKGTFDMGCTPEQESDCRGDEKPVHKVTISNDFYMMKSEVTKGLYKKVMRRKPSKFKKCGSDCPVESVSWYDAVKFANALSKKEGLEQCYSIFFRKVTWSKGVDCTGWRLPTEAEWEYAARGGESYKYSGSNNLDEVAWYGENSSSKTHSVCSKETNGYGLCDMSGNVFEWVWDWYDEDYYQSTSENDPTGPSTGSGRVRRGGSWYQGASSARVSSRGRLLPSIRFYDLGFRLTRTIR